MSKILQNTKRNKIKCLPYLCYRMHNEKFSDKMKGLLRRRYRLSTLYLSLELITK